MNNKISVFETVTTDEMVLLEELQTQISDSDVAGMIFFCSSEYDMPKLAQLLSDGFHFPIAGCTTAGEIGSHYQNQGFVAVCFPAQYFHLHLHFIEDVTSFDSGHAYDFLSDTMHNLKLVDSLKDNVFGFLMIDGLSMREELVIAYLYEAFSDISIIGGSAADDLKFDKTYIYSRGQFHNNAAVFMVIESKVEFEVFKLQHFVPSNKDMIVTHAEPEKRVVYEINGDTAADEYAKTLGLSTHELSSDVFALHPVMLQIGDDWYVRSIQQANEDGSLQFASAIDNGLPLTVGQGVDLLSNLEDKVDDLNEKFDVIDLTLGCDCIHRRFEIMQLGLQKQVEDELQKISFAGFSSYGEQYNALHVNQTFTGITLGKRAIQGNLA